MKVPYEQIAAYLSGKALPWEKAEVDEWLAESAEHRSLFRSLEKEWSFLKEGTPLSLPDKEQVWTKIRGMIDLPVTAASYSKQVLIKYISLTACIALLFGVALSLLFNSGRGESTQFTAYAPLGEKAQLTLPDSSRVWLNSGSTLTYFTQSRQRRVHLQGEAFFEVTKDPRKVFIVQSGDVSVQVHGTSFNVSAYDTDPYIAVSLESGLVSLFNNKNGVVLAQLQPNQMGRVSKADLSCSIVADDTGITKLWTNNILKVYDNNIYEVVKKLERWYGVDITLENANPDSRYTFVVKTESMKELLGLLNKMTPIAYKIEGKEVTIRLR